MKCEEVRENLRADLDGEAPEEVSRHVAKCRDCREAQGYLGDVRGILRQGLGLEEAPARGNRRWIPLSAAALFLVATLWAVVLNPSAPPRGPVAVVRIAEFFNPDRCLPAADEEPAEIYVRVLRAAAQLEGSPRLVLQRLNVMVVHTSPGADPAEFVPGVLYHDPGVDRTDDVLRLVNEEYRKEKE